jgi:N-acetylglucosaminyldiphosphoundecaprenol N-acetyl-beta-D-mannosaminyltransferase
MQQSHLNGRVNVLGVGVSATNMAHLLRDVESALSNGQKGYVCVTGVHGVMEAQRDKAFRAILNNSFANTPDGMPTVWVGRLTGHSAMRRVFGPELMLEVCAKSVEKGWTHFLYGGGPGVVESLKGTLERRFPGIRIVGTYTPPFRPLSEAEDRELVRTFAAVKPDLCWVGLSTPKQERFMAEYSDKLETKLMFGVGAAFDYHTGRIEDAPVWMKEAGLQWFHRLCQDPKRLWRRYLRNNPEFLVRITAQMLGLNKSGTA